MIWFPRVRIKGFSSCKDLSLCRCSQHTPLPTTAPTTFVHFANRKNIDVEIFSKALKNYASDPERDYRKLRKYATKMKIGEKVDSILEVL